MEPRDSSRRRVRFGAFEADLRAGELFHQGRRIKLHGQPFHVLRLLLEQPGELVTREELRATIWPVDTFVDFDQGLNKAILKIREALGDSAAKPRYVETLPRRGYRFITAVEPVNGETPTASHRVSTEAIPESLLPPGNNGASTVRAPTTLPQPPGNEHHTFEGGLSPAPITGTESASRLPKDATADSSTIREQRGQTVWAVAAAAGIGIAVFGLLLSRPQAAPTVLSYTRLTEGAHIRWGLMATNGAQVYFNATDAQGRWIIGSVSSSGGEIVPLRVPLDMPVLDDISPDGTKLLVSDPGGEDFIVPVTGGWARRVGDLEGDYASWAPDGRHILYSNTQGTFICDMDGNARKKVSNLAMEFGVQNPPRMSPNGKVLTVWDGEKLWQARIGGAEMHPLLQHLARGIEGCCGSWTRDSKYFLFEGRPNEARFVGDIWASWKDSSLFGASDPRLTQLTFGPLSFTSPTPSPDGKRIFAVGTMGRGQVVWIDPKTSEQKLFLPQLPSAYIIDFSKDGRFITYVRFADGALWKARRDGSNPLQLTSPPIQADFPQWSPDGKYISFTDLATSKIYLIPADGGSPQELAPGFQCNDTGWSPDGSEIVFGRNPPPSAAFYIFNRRSGRITKVPGSDGMLAPRWSPDGRYLAGVSMDDGLRFFDFNTRKWTGLAPVEIQYHTWSSNSRFLYFTSHLGGVWGVFRVGIRERKLERVMSLAGFQPIQDLHALYPWFGLAPDGSFLLLTNPGGEEIYSLDFKAP